MLSANSFVSNSKSPQKQQQNNIAVIRPVLTVQEKLAQDLPSLPPQVCVFFFFFFKIENTGYLLSYCVFIKWV